MNIFTQITTRTRLDIVGKQIIICIISSDIYGVYFKFILPTKKYKSYSYTTNSEFAVNTHSARGKNVITTFVPYSSIKFNLNYMTDYISSKALNLQLYI